MQCSRCNSFNIIPHVYVIDQGQYSQGNLRVAVAANPNAFVFKEWVLGNIWANICGDCGHMDFFVDNPQRLFQAYQQNIRS